MSNRLKWKPGKRGKGLVMRNGDVHTWPLDVRGGPEHGAYRDLHNLEQPQFWYYINPDGYVHDNDISFNNQSNNPDDVMIQRILQADPNQHRNKSPEDDWELDEQMPGSSETAARPDYNFVLGSEWTQMMNPGVPCPRCKSNDTVLQDENRIRCSRCRYVFAPPNLLAMADPSTQHGYDSDSFFHSKVAGKGFHLNRNTGLPCNCPWGHNIPMARTAGVEWNRFKKSLGKKFMQLPNAQEYVDAMESNLSDDPNGWVDGIVPFLNKEFKAGRIGVINGTLKASGSYITAGPYGTLSQWGRWAAARQHPTRRGVNITSPDFTVDDIKQRTDKFMEDMEDQQRREEYAEQCKDSGRVVQEWPDGWHVKDISNPADMELEGEVMDHCIGNDGEHPYSGYSYKDAANDGQIRVFSLRDPHGMPHATYHQNPGGELAEIHGRANHALKPEYEERVGEHLDQIGARYHTDANGNIAGSGSDFENWGEPEEEEEEENPYSTQYGVEGPETVDQYKAIHENGDYDGMVSPEYYDALRWAEEHYGDEPELYFNRPHWPAIGDDFLNEVDQYGLDPSDFIQLVAQRGDLSNLYTAVQSAREDEYAPSEPSMQDEWWSGHDTPESTGQLYDPGHLEDTEDWEPWHENRKAIDDAFKEWENPDGSFMDPYTKMRKQQENHIVPASQPLFQQHPYVQPDEQFKYPVWDAVPGDETAPYLNERQMAERKKNQAYDKMMELSNSGMSHEQIRAQFPTLGTGQTDTPEELAWMNFQVRPDAALQGQIGEPQSLGNQQPAGQLNSVMTAAQLREGDTFTMAGGFGRTYRAEPRDGRMWAVSTDGSISTALTGIENVIQTGAAYRPPEQGPMGILEPRQGSTDTDYADELQQWLADIGEPEEPIAPTPHHQSPQDIAPRPPLAFANEPPYWPPGHVPDWADPSAEGRTSAEDALIERAITPAEYDAGLEPRKERGPWLKRLFRRR